MPVILHPRQQAEILRKFQRQRFASAPPVLPPFAPTCEKTRRFMASEKKISVLCGGNRAGKSYGNCRKAVEFAASHPGAIVWLLTINYKMVGSVLAALVLKQLPPEFIQEIAWSNYRLRIPDLIRLHNGAELVFKTYDSKFEALQGAAVDLVIMDEEPVDRNIFTECLARTLDKRGKVSMSFTPLHGMGCWTYEGLFLASQQPNSDIDFFTVSLFDNPYIPQDEKDRIVALYGKDEVDRRIWGLFTLLSGVVFKELKPELHFIPRFPIPADWRKARAIDLGYNHPFVCLWGALSPDNELYIYAEHVQAERLLSEHAETIRQIDSDRTLYADLARYTPIENTMSDHARQERAELETHGIYSDPANKDVDLSIQIVNRLLKPNALGRPKLFVFNDLAILTKQMQGYRYMPVKPGMAGKEAPLKIDDDAVDALRYLVMYFFADQYDLAPIESTGRLDFPI